MSLYAGIDAGSRALKIVMVDDDGRVVARGIADQGAAQGVLIDELIARTLTEHGMAAAAIAATVATGYARNLVANAVTRTEITCHARGVAHLHPGARTVVEVGGQDSKLLRLSPAGTVLDFAMNDRCAAGTGRFLETVAARLAVELDALDVLAASSTAPAAITSTCVVFAESEIIGLLAAGTPPTDIAAGVRDALARRVALLAGGRVTAPVVFTGGVALVPGMADALAIAFDAPVTTAVDPQYTGALGAALLARDGEGAE